MIAAATRHLAAATTTTTVQAVAVDPVVRVEAIADQVLVLVVVAALVDIQGALRTTVRAELAGVVALQRMTVAATLPPPVVEAPALLPPASQIHGGHMLIGREEVRLLRCLPTMMECMGGPLKAMEHFNLIITNCFLKIIVIPAFAR